MRIHFPFYFYFSKISWTLSFLEVVKGVKAWKRWFQKVNSNLNHWFSPALFNSLPCGEASKIIKRTLIHSPALPVTNRMILTRSLYPLSLSLLIYKVDKTDFPISGSYCEAPSVQTHSVALQITPQEMHSQQQCGFSVSPTRLYSSFLRTSLNSGPEMNASDRKSE